MKLSPKAQSIYSRLDTASIKMGDLKKLAKEIKLDHDLAVELWNTKNYYARLLSVLILDKRMLSAEFLNLLDNDLQKHSFDEKNHIMEWLMANQLMKSKRTITIIESWENSPRPLQRRTFWYYQARLRWTGQTSPENTEVLLSKIESNISTEQPEVQWAMNFTAAWIGIYTPNYRQRCINIGEETGLYKDEVVNKGCTPNYLPAFITTEVAKREKS